MVITRSIRFLAVEKITFLYIIITSIIILGVASNLSNWIELFEYRLLIVITIVIVAYFNSLKNWWLIRLTRYMFLGALLSFWYPDTFDINRAFTNHDYLLAKWEFITFGCQPATLFSQNYPQQWVSEILNMGYFAYYPILLGTTLYFFFFCKKHFEQFFFVLIFSFFVYYLVYILFPTAGPQYYFPAVGLTNIQAGIFPALGNYFDLHPILLDSAPRSGFFFQMVEHTQSVGERPTAAFPSSHVGISTLVLFMFLRFKKYWLFVLVLPVYIALVAATVYIQAHYVIDVISGLGSAFVLYYLSSWVYQLFTRRYVGLSELSTILQKDSFVKGSK